MEEKTFEEYADENNLQGQIKMEDYIKWLNSFTKKTIKEEEHEQETCR